MPDGFLWGDAAVTYPDWKGTAQLDERMTGDTFLNVLVGLDRDEWFIIGMNIGGGEHEHDLHVVAVHRDAGSNLSELAAQNGGEIPATEFRIHGADPYRVLKAITHMFELRLRVSSCEGLPIRIMSQSDVPEQFMQD